jgi:hypothetical protein
MHDSTEAKVTSAKSINFVSEMNNNNLCPLVVKAFTSLIRTNIKLSFLNKKTVFFTCKTIKGYNKHAMNWNV